MVSLKMQNFVAQVRLMVVDLTLPFDVILGDAWLRTHCAVLDYQAGSLTVWKQHRRFKLRTADLSLGALLTVNPVPLEPLDARRLRPCDSDCLTS